MAVYNGSPFLRTAIDSILQQTYRNFRFLIVDDASTDDTREIVGSYPDERIELLCLDRNVGQTAALSRGLHHASTPWIARMDADDYSAPTRFEEQMNALAEDPSICCLGTFAWIFRDDPDVVEGEISTPIRYADITQVVAGSPIIHGSIVIDREKLLSVGGYDDHYRILADIEMYDRFLPRYSAAAIPKQLLGVRRHRGQSSNSKAACEEAIEIAIHRLAKNDYPGDQEAIVRGALIRNHLLRARYLAGEGKWLDAFRDVMRALRAAPSRFFSECVVVFVAYNVSERQRGRIKQLMRRAKSLFRS